MATDPKKLSGYFVVVVVATVVVVAEVVATAEAVAERRFWWSLWAQQVDA